MRTLSVAATYLRLGVLNEMQYRANFFVAVFQSLLAVGVGLAVLALVYSHTATLNGWTRSQLLVILGVQILLGGVVHMSIQPNMERLVEEVRDGKLDFLLTKPEDAQLMVSVRVLQLWQFVEIVSGSIVVGVGISQLAGSIGLGHSIASGSSSRPARSGS
jgi:ABC-2 type transport system permease protein